MRWELGLLIPSVPSPVLTNRRDWKAFSSGSLRLVSIYIIYNRFDMLHNLQGVSQNWRNTAGVRIFAFSQGDHVSNKKNAGDNAVRFTCRKNIAPSTCSYRQVEEKGPMSSLDKSQFIAMDCAFRRIGRSSTTLWNAQRGRMDHRHSYIAEDLWHQDTRLPGKQEGYERQQS